MVDTLHHTVGNLLTNLNTCIVSSLLLVVASVGTLVQTLNKLSHVGGINFQITYEILLQALCLCHTDGIAQGVDISFQTSSWS